MSELNQAQFAKQAGVSKPAIAKAIKKGRLSLNGSKKIDDQHPLSIAYLNNQLNKSKLNVQREQLKLKKQIARSDNPAPVKAPSSKTKTKEPKQSAVDRTVKKTKEPEPKSRDRDDHIRIHEDDREKGRRLYKLDKAELEDQKLIEAILEKQIKNDQLRGNLIDRQFVAKLFNKIYSIDVNQFLQLGTSISTKMTVVFKVSDKKLLMEARKSIEEDLYKIQDHIKLEIDNFLNDMNKAVTDDEE